MFLEVAQCSLGTLGNTRGHLDLLPCLLRTASPDVAALGLLGRGHQLRPALGEVASLGLLQQRSVVQACSLSSRSLVLASVRVAASGLL